MALFRICVSAPTALQPLRPTGVLLVDSAKTHTHAKQRRSDVPREGLTRGLSAGDPPDRFLVGLAVLGLLSEVAEVGPVLCVIDDAQWLDQTSAVTLAFVARRLLAEPVGVVLAVREVSDTYHGLADIELDGLRNDAAMAILNSAVRSKLDAGARPHLGREARQSLGAARASHGLSVTELAGFGAGAIALSPNGIEESFRRRLSAFPTATRRLMLVASALGGPLWCGEPRSCRAWASRNPASSATPPPPGSRR